MTRSGTSMGRQIGEKAVKAVIGVVGLLVLRLILSALPMVRHPIVYMSPVSAEIGAGIPAAIDLNGLLQAQQEVKSLPPAEMQQLQQAFGAITPAQGLDFEKFYDQVAGVNASLGRVMADALTRMHVVILPITIINAVIDTLIFVLLILFGRDVSAIMRSSAMRLPEMGPTLNLAVVAIAVALAYNSYKGILYPFLFPNNIGLYGWIFLAMGLAPLVGIGVLVARNTDAISAALLHGGGAVAVANTGVVTCPHCGSAAAVGAKFCPNCAAPLAVARKTFCPSCGVENSAMAKFCGGCGQILAG